MLIGVLVKDCSVCLGCAHVFTLCVCVVVCVTNAQNHFGIHTHIVKQPFYIHPPPPQKNVRETTKSSTSQKRRKWQVAHSVSCQLEYSGECLSTFTYKCHLLSSQGLGKVLLSPPWCAWQTFLPPYGRQACDAQWESERKLNAFCLWCLLPVVFLFYAPLLRCNLCIQTGVHRLCFHFTERWGSVLFEKAAEVVITEEALWLGFLMEGFCCGGGIINTKWIISVSRTANKEFKMWITPKNGLTTRVL